MYRNFICFIVALLIYATYQPAEEPNFNLGETLAYLMAFFAVFAILGWAQFRRLEARLNATRISSRGHQFNVLLNRQIVLAVFIFAVDVYGLNLSFYTSRLSLFQLVPTLEAVLFLFFFMGYLALTWALAHRSHCRVFHSQVTVRAYVFSNLMFSIPVLLPWFLLSLVSDLILALPFQAPKQVLSTTAGEISYFLVFLLLVAFLGPAIIQKFWRCKPLQTGAQRTNIEALCRRAELRYKEILLWPIFEGRMITAGVMGLLGSIYFYCYAAMQLPAGLLSDSVGPRRTVTTFLVAASAGSILFGLAPNIEMAFVGRILVGFGVSMVFIPTMKILSQWYHPHEFASMAGILNAVGGAGVMARRLPRPGKRPARRGSRGPARAARCPRPAPRP